MKRRPRSPDEPVIAPALGVRLGFAGLLIAVGTLAVVAWGEDRYDLAVATTMGLTTISLLHIVAALEWRDPYRSIFTRDTFANGRFNLLMLAALALTFLATTIDGLNTILDTVELDGDQWRACLIAVVGYFVLAELGKFVLRLVERRRRDVVTSVRQTGADRRRAARRTRDQGQPRRARHAVDGRRRVRPAVPRRARRRRQASLAEGIEQLKDAQELLWASDSYAVLVVFQAMDAAGKDSTIKHVMSGVNPQGVQVVSFKQPSSEELDHTFLWRISKALPSAAGSGSSTGPSTRRSSRSACTPSGSRPAAAGRRPRPRVLGRPLRRPQRVRAPPRPQRHQGRQVLPPRLQG